ncbi:MAG: glucose 1-dehydrogenase [Anaerolineae bacterium]|nr:glucose 1-dehydrogenase [Anaerolineae bacterium]
MRLENKVVLITGAGSGMGREVALLFAKEGARVVLNDLVPETVEETAQMVTQAGGAAIAIAGNVADEADVEKTVKAGVEKFGKLDTLYNNAGIMPNEDESVTTMKPDVWRRVLDVNLNGLALCCKYGIPQIIKAGGGAVVNVASFVALVGCSVPQDAYTASKGAVIALTQSLAVQFGPKGVRSNAICPGPIITPLMETLFATEAAKMLRLNRIPMGRFGQPHDVAYAALFLASDEASWINGASLVVDGGITVNYF